MKLPLTWIAAPLLALALVAQALAQPAPRTPDGRPDLSGYWSNVSLTKLERPGSLNGLTLSDTQAKGLAANDMILKMKLDRSPVDPEAGPPSPGGSTGHDAIFLDNGDAYARIDGAYRSSWIVDTPDGRLPLTPLGERRRREAAAMSNRMDPAGPEDLAPNDRCLIGSRGSGGPGMLNNVYNSNYQFLLTRDALTVVVEMGFGVRIIPIYAAKATAQSSHRPAVLGHWMGDSTAWWEGGTLLVETVDVNPLQGRFGPIFLSENGRVTERLTRTSKNEIAYEFTVEDPVHYTRTWRAEMIMTALNGVIYEYACHEGNYAMSGILGGARAAEREAGTR